MNNGITKENLMRSLPSVLYDDTRMRFLAEAVASELESLAALPSAAKIYQRIDTLPNDLCDILARDFKIDWWRNEAPIDEKRAALKSSWFVHHHLGTKAAIERAVSNFLGTGTVNEWFEYDGQPHHFRISSENNSAIISQYDEFLAVLNAVKRCSSVLDHITSRLEKKQTVFVGIAMGITTSGSATATVEPIPMITFIAYDDDTMLGVEDDCRLIM